MWEARSRYITRFQKDDAKREAALNALAYIEREMQNAYDVQANFIAEGKNKLLDVLNEAYGSERDAHEAFAEEIEDADWFYREDNNQVKLTIGRALQMYVSIVQSDYATNVEKWKRDGEFRKKLEDLLDIHNPDSPHLKFIEGMRQLYTEMGGALDEVLYRTTGTHLRTPNRNYMPVKMKNPLEAKMGEGRAFKPFAASLTPRVKNGLDFDQEADIISVFQSRLTDAAHTIAFAERGPMIMRIAQSSRVLTAIDSSFGTDARKKWCEHILDIVAGVRTKTADEAKVMGMIMRYASRLWIGLNPASWAKQIASVPCFALSREVGLFGLARAQSMWLTKPIEMLGVVRDLTATEAWKARYGTAINQELRYAVGDATAAESLWQKWINTSMSGVSYFDKVGILVDAGVYARRREELELSGIPKEEASELAAQFVMHLADKTMQSGREVNMTEAQRNGGLAAFVQFKSSPMQMLQFEMLAVMEYTANPNGKNLKKLLEVIIINHAIAPALMALVDIGMIYLTSFGEPDDEKKRRLLARILGEFISGPWSSLFIIGSIIDAAVGIPMQYLTGAKSKYGSINLVPAESALDFMITEASKISNTLSEITEKDILETMSEIGLSSAKLTPGLSWGVRTAEKIYKSAHADEDEEMKRKRLIRERRKQLKEVR